MYQGSCLCGSVRFAIEGELEPIQLCHCSQCRKAHGTPFASNIPMPATAFRLFSGSDSLKSYESSPGKQRVFCGNCGSPIYSQNEKLPGVLRIRAGTLEGELGTRPQAHIYVGSKANWWELSDDLPRFEGGKK